MLLMMCLNVYVILCSHYIGTGCSWFMVEEEVIGRG